MNSQYLVSNQKEVNFGLLCNLRRMNSVSRYNQTLHQYNQTLHQYKSERICENTENTENRYTGNVDSVEKSLPEIFKKIKIKQKTHSRGLYLPINVE